MGWRGRHVNTGNIRPHRPGVPCRAFALADVHYVLYLRDYHFDPATLTGKAEDDRAPFHTDPPIWTLLPDFWWLQRTCGGEMKPCIESGTLILPTRLVRGDMHIMTLRRWNARKAPWWCRDFCLKLLPANHSTRGAKEIERWNGFSGWLPKPATSEYPHKGRSRREMWSNASRYEGKLAYIKLTTQTPCPPRGAVPVNSGRSWEFFTLCLPVRTSVMDATNPAMSAKY